MLSLIRLRRFLKFLSRFSFFGLFLLVIFLSSCTSSQSDNVVSFQPWSKGAVQAKVVIKEYSDFQCPACRAYFSLVEQLLQEFPDSVALEYHHFPLRSIHKYANLAAQASEAAGLQDAFWPMHKLLFEHQTDWVNASDPKEVIFGYAESLSLDIPKFKNDLENDIVLDRIDEDYKKGIELGIRGTPTFFINDILIENPKSYEEFRSVVQSFLNQAS